MCFDYFKKKCCVMIFLFFNLSFVCAQESNFANKSHTINSTYTLIASESVVTIKNGSQTIVEFNDFIPKVKGAYGNNYLLFDVIIPEGKVSAASKLAVYFDDEPIFLSKDNLSYSFILKSVKEDYLTRQFYIYVLFEPESGTLNVVDVVGVERSPQCMNELVSVKEFNKHGVSVLNTKSLMEIYSYLYATDAENDEGKIPLLNDIQLYNRVFSDYKNKIDITNGVDLFVMKDEDDNKCQPSSYIVGRWFWIERIDMSNNVAYFLSERGYYQEAIILLEKIIDASPNRTSAYINMADALWAVQQYDEASNFYGEYILKMKKKKMESEIPVRAIKRSKL